MIFLIAGTEDGRELAEFLLKNNFDVTASVVSSYGKILLSKYEGIKINEKKLDENELTEFLLKKFCTKKILKFSSMQVILMPLMFPKMQ